jgi:ankyrin repeat protein
MTGSAMRKQMFAYALIFISSFGVCIFSQCAHADCGIEPSLMHAQTEEYRNLAKQHISNHEWGKLRYEFYLGLKPTDLDESSISPETKKIIEQEYLDASLLVASQNNKNQDIDELLNKGADIDARISLEGNSLTSIQIASECGYEKIVEMLAKKGANINILSERFISTKTKVLNLNALMLAVYNDHPEVAALLIANGADVNKQSSYIDDVSDKNAKQMLGATPLLFATNAGVTKLLLIHHANPNITSSDGRTPLMNAAYRGDSEAVKILVSYGAKPCMRDVKGLSAAGYAKQNGHDEIVNYLNPLCAIK